MTTVRTFVAKEMGRASKFGAFAVSGIDICGFLPDPLRTICRGIGGQDPVTPPNDGFNPGAPGAGCPLPGQQVDPITGECRFFFGTQPGPNGGGGAVVGGFGLPAIVPGVVGQITRKDGTTGSILRCPQKMVLGTDNLCYPKAVLPRRSKFRKWRGDVRPAVSAGDVKAIRKAAAAKERVLNLAKDVGLFASKTRPAPRPKAHQHLIAPPVQELRVISEHTN